MSTPGFMEKRAWLGLGIGLAWVTAACAQEMAGGSPFPPGETGTSHGDFTPEANPYARRIVGKTFQTVVNLREIEPDVLAAFYVRVPAGEIANRGESFQATDVMAHPGLPRQRLVLAGRAPGLWFVLYEQGGRGVRHVLSVLAAGQGGAWRVVETASGLVPARAESSELEQLQAALENGLFTEQTVPGRK